MTILCAKCGKEHRNCSSHRSRDGEPCDRRPMLGMTVCYTHGGAAGQTRRAAARRVEGELIQKRAASVVAVMMGRDPDTVDPVRELLECLTIASISERALAQMVDDAGVSAEDQSVHKETLYQKWERAIDRRATFAEKAIKAGVAIREVQIAEQQGHQMIVLFDAAIADAGLDQETRQRLRAALGQRAAGMSVVGVSARRSQDNPNEEHHGHDDR